MTTEARATTYLLTGAAFAGLIHAGFSLYWALGGRWLLPTVGKWAVTNAREAPVAAGLLLITVAAVKGTVAIAPCWRAEGRPPTQARGGASRGSPPSCSPDTER